MLIAGTASLAGPLGILPGARPVRRGEYIEIYGTGLGAVDNRPRDGWEAKELDSTVPIHGMPMPQKIEGLTVLDGETIAIANDNDFGVGVVQPLFTVVGDSCTLNDTGLESKIVVIHLEQELK